jgi:hypothetical protein
MYHTLAQAEEKLARFADGGACDVRAAINDALEQLANIEAWRCLRRIVRLTVEHDVLPLPQSIDALLRVSVSGKPSHVFGSDYQFLQNGPGDLDSELNADGVGFSDYGAGHCTMFDIVPDDPAVPVMFAGSQSDVAKAATIHGLDASGQSTRLTVPLRKWAGSPGVADFDPAAVTGVRLKQIDGVVLPSGLRGYATLYGSGASAVRFLAKYHPDVIVPEFRRYRVNWTVDSTEPVSVLAEVRLRFLPLVAATDIVPFDSLAAVQFMMQAVKEINAGNLQAGVAFQTLAVARLEEREAAQVTTQGIKVENVLHDLSMGAATGLATHNL